MSEAPYSVFSSSPHARQCAPRKFTEHLVLSSKLGTCVASGMLFCVGKRKQSSSVIRQSLRPLAHPPFFLTVSAPGLGCLISPMLGRTPLSNGNTADIPSPRVCYAFAAEDHYFVSPDRAHRTSHQCCRWTRLAHDTCSSTHVVDCASQRSDEASMSFYLERVQGDQSRCGVRRSWPPVIWAS